MRALGQKLATPCPLVRRSGAVKGASCLERHVGNPQGRKQGGEVGSVRGWRGRAKLEGACGQGGPPSAGCGGRWGLRGPPHPQEAARRGGRRGSASPGLREEGACRQQRPRRVGARDASHVLTAALEPPRGYWRERGWRPKGGSPISCALGVCDARSFTPRSCLPQPWSEPVGAPQVWVPVGGPGADGGIGVVCRPQPPHHHGREAVELG